MEGLNGFSLGPCFHHFQKPCYSQADALLVLEYALVLPNAKSTSSGLIFISGSRTVSFHWCDITAHRAPLSESFLPLNGSHRHPPPHRPCTYVHCCCALQPAASRDNSPTIEPLFISSLVT